MVLAVAKGVDPAVANWALVGVLALPHIFYAYMWFNSDRWLQRFGKNAVVRFESVAWGLKVAQFAAVVGWYIVHQPRGVDLLAVPLTHWALAAALLGAGQALNIGIYKAIGRDGVYYGFKLGHHVPWVDGFPFNVVQHPQYVGSVLSILGAAVFVSSQAPPSLWTVVAYWTALYGITAWQESCC